MTAERPSARETLPETGGAACPSAVMPDPGVTNDRPAPGEVGVPAGPHLQGWANGTAERLSSASAARASFLPTSTI